jgi:hypothetical protein
VEAIPKMSRLEAAIGVPPRMLPSHTEGVSSDALAKKEDFGGKSVAADG